jgi:UDP-2-acetamido-3-amino-2,3-dideoxy-glucuronate N-acetyltransferase
VGEPFVHQTATVEEGATVGEGSTVWHHAHVRADAHVGSDCIVGKGVYIGAGVRVGDRCKIQNYAMIFEGAEVGNGVFIGPGALLANDRYPRAVTPDGELKAAEDWTLGHVVVEDGASIGAGAIVVPDARIGRWAMVGAGALVTKDVPEHQLVAGNPARAIGYVCRCGHRLSETKGKWHCSNCGRDYDLPAMKS